MRSHIASVANSFSRGFAIPSGTLFASWADAGVTLSTGVSHWTSQQPPGYTATQPTNILQPGFVSNSVGSRSYLTGSGSQYLQNDSTAAGGSWTNNGAWSMFAVINCASQTQGVLSIGATSTNFAAQLRVLTTGRVQVQKRGSSDGGAIAAVTLNNAFTNGNWTVIGAVCAGTTVDIYGGVTATPKIAAAAFSSAGGLTTPSIGRIIGDTAGTGWAGSIAAVFIDDAAWNSTEVASFMGSVTTYYAGAVT